jgi:DNA-binding MarR family transcriptional regulator
MQPEQDLVTALTSAVSRLAREITSGQSPDLSVGGMSILAGLDARPGISPADLAAAENMTPPSITRHLKALKARELIEMAPHLQDRRRVRITVTDKGRHVLAQARQVAWLTVRVAELPEESRAVLDTAVPILDELSH